MTSGTDRSGTDQSGTESGAAEQPEGATEHDPLIGEVPDPETAAAPEAALQQAVREQERQLGVGRDDDDREDQP